MKKIFLCLVLVSFIFGIAPAQEQEGWKVEKGSHFLIYYKNAPEDFISQVLNKAEDYYNAIADDLGFRRFDFWLWDNRARIYIFDDAAGYQAGTGQPGWSVGCARIADKVIDSYPYAKGFTEEVLPHEMAHIIFREFVGFDNPAIPLWLDEGVASYEQKEKFSGVQDIISQAIENKSFMSLDKLSSFSLHSSNNKKLIDLYYCESFSIVDFLIRNYGRDKFVLFCQNLRDKRSLEKAVISSYPFNSLGEFAAAWQKELTNE